MISKGKLLILFGIYGLIIFLWNQPYLLPLKTLVILLHEISHALGALLTGGEVASIVISWNESGYTVTEGGIFIAVAAAGYIGSIFWGSGMLFCSLKGKYHRYLSIFLGFLVIYFTLKYIQKTETSIVTIAIAWAVFLIFTGLFLSNVNRYALYLMGGLTSLYGTLDLTDFLRISRTDAGRIADYYIQDPVLNTVFAYFIAILISIISIWILLKFTFYGLNIPQIQDPEETETNEPDVLKILQEFSEVKKETSEQPLSVKE